MTFLVFLSSFLIFRTFSNADCCKSNNDPTRKDAEESKNESGALEKKSSALKGDWARLLGYGYK